MILKEYVLLAKEEKQKADTLQKKQKESKAYPGKAEIGENASYTDQWRNW